MFVGIDHGTTAIRFATHDTVIKIPRNEAVSFDLSVFETFFPKDEILGIALTYSMGDNFSEISSIDQVVNRGVISQQGAGEHIGGGTKVYDTFLASDFPVIVIPGIHRDSPTDIRFKVYSHQASPEKVGIAYFLIKSVGPDVIFCDVSSNTVSLLVKDGKIIGGFDACIFAPGRVHGALDLEAIRAIDAGQMTAADGFLHAGVNTKMDFGTSSHFSMSDEEKTKSLAMFAAMECASLLLLAPHAPVVLCGSLAEELHTEVSRLLKRPLILFDEWAAAKGLAMIAQAVYGGATEIAGLLVRENATKRSLTK